MNKIFKWDKYIALFSVLALFLVLGISYAVVSWTTDDYNIALDSACMDINYVKGRNINTSVGMVNESEAFVGSEIVMNSNMAFTTVDMELNEECYDINGLATIKINISNLSSSFKAGGDAYGYLKYVVAEYDPTQYQTLDMSELEDKSFNALIGGNIYNEGVIDAYTTYLEPGVKKSYLVIFYIKKLSKFASGTFSASIDTEVVQTDEVLPEYTPISDFTYYIGTYNNFELPEGKVLLFKYNGSNSVVNIPSKYTINGVDYEPIVNANNCFSGNLNITKVVFPFGIQFSKVGQDIIYNVGDNLFRYCSNLREVYNLGYSVATLEYAFYECTSLVTAPDIPDSVTELEYAFYSCSSLVKAPVIGNSVVNMDYTFYNCYKLVGVSAIPDSVVRMPYTFYNCTSLVIAPVIGNSVVSMENTFCNCTSLVTASEIPQSVTRLNRTFYGCTSLTGTIRIKAANLELFGGTYNPFRNTTKPITVEVPSGSKTVTSINSGKPSNVTIVEY